MKLNNIEAYAESFIKEMQKKKYAIETIKTYTYAIQTYLTTFINKETIDDISTDEIKSYLYSFENVNTQIAYYSPLKLFYELVLKDKNKFKDFPRPKRNNIVKLYYSKTNILSKISSIDNVKHKTILSLAFSTGMKTTEVLNVKLEDINRQTKKLLVRNSIEEIVRIIPLTDKVLRLIDNYIKLYNPTIYLFNGQHSPKYSKKSCECVVKKWLGEDYSMSLLRNSLAVNLYKNGTDIKLIQKQLGLKSIKETKRYVKGITKKEIPQIIIFPL